jgi:hypothetical protein
LCMFKKTHDTVPVLKYIFLLATLLYTVRGSGQSVTIEDTATEAGAHIYFDSVSMEALPPVVLRKVPDTLLRRIRKNDAYWYADLAPEKKKKQEKEKAATSLLDRQWFRSLLWIIIVAGFVAVLIWYLASSNIRLFRRPSALIGPDEETVPALDIFELDYEQEIQRAVADRNFRMAVRLMYLHILKELSERNIIQYKHEKTNSEYLSELAGTSYYKNFFRLTRDFEYTWYGELELSEQAFVLVQKDFSNFKEELQ